MSVWVECLVSIRFDLDIGPKVEYVTPAGALSEAGRQHLLRVAFPDCNPDCGHDFIFFFTTTDCTAVADEIQSATVADPSHGSTVSKIHGAAYYRQKRDPNVPRGYVQQVVVLLSRVPYLVAHELILRVIVPRFAQCCALSPDTDAVPVASALSPAPTTFFALDMAFNPNHYTQDDVLNEAVREIANWPTPHPRVRYEVMLLHQPLSFTTPSRALRSFARVQQNAVHRPQMVLDERVRLLDRDVMDATDSSLCSAFMAVPLYGVLGDVLHYLTRLWELVICHEPVCIIGNTPSTASAAAVAVASLVLPITFNGVLRAYFTVQDEFFGRFSRMGKALPFPQDEGLIVAGTNPFLIRSFDGWPTLLAVSDRYANSTGSFQGVGGTTAPSVGLTSTFPPVILSSPTRLTVSAVHTFNTSSTTVIHAPGSALTSSPSSAVAGQTLHMIPASPATTSTTDCTSPVCAPTSRFVQSTTNSETDDANDDDDDADVAQAKEEAAAMLGLPYGCTLAARTPASPSCSFASCASPPPPSSGSASSAAEKPHGEDSASGAAPSTGVHVTVPFLRAVRSTGVEAEEQADANPLPSSNVESGSVMTAESMSAPIPIAHAASSQAASAGHRDPATDVLPPLPRPATSASCSNDSFGTPVFSQADFSALVASRRIAGQSSIAKSNPSNSRAKLQHHLRNYFDSSYPFVLDHEAHTSALYKRLEAVSKMDEQAQRTSSALLSGQFSSTSPASAVTQASPSPGYDAPPAHQRQSPRQNGAGTASSEAEPVRVAEDGADRSQFLVADDVVRKFFISLTREFLSPVTTWFALTTASLNAFQLCDRSSMDVLLSGDSFLQYFLHHHREVAPAMVRKTHNYKGYKRMYERFAQGKLFVEYMRQLVQERLRTDMSFFQVEAWAAQFPSDAERVDMFINLYNVVKRELELCIDPDVILVTTATAVLASMAVFINEPLREQFMMKIGDLRL